MKFKRKVRAFFNTIYYKRKLQSVGKNCRFIGNAYISDPKNVSVGDNFIMHSNCVIASKEKVVIGNDVTMSRGSQILTGEYDTDNWTNEKYKKRIHRYKPVTIGDGTWLCVNAIILPGVSLSGKGIIVAAGAVVTESFNQDYVVLAGNPARIVKTLDQEDNKNDTQRND